jgi:hypothetical protein
LTKTALCLSGKTVKEIIEYPSFYDFFFFLGVQEQKLLQKFVLAPLRGNKNHKNLDIERIHSQYFLVNIKLFLPKIGNFVKFNQLLKIIDNFDRPKSF